MRGTKKRIQRDRSLPRAQNRRGQRLQGHPCEAAHIECGVIVQREVGGATPGETGAVFRGRGGFALLTVAALAAMIFLTLGSDYGLWFEDQERAPARASQTPHGQDQEAEPSGFTRIVHHHDTVSTLILPGTFLFCQ
jgi:hypothetical protein